jgi:hypothetical protein
MRVSLWRTREIDGDREYHYREPGRLMGIESITIENNGD